MKNRYVDIEIPCNVAEYVPSMIEIAKKQRLEIEMLKNENASLKESRDFFIKETDKFERSNHIDNFLYELNINENMNKINSALKEIGEKGVCIIQQYTPPADAKEGDLWLDTSDDEFQGTLLGE